MRQAATRALVILVACVRQSSTLQQQRVIPQRREHQIASTTPSCRSTPVSPTDDNSYKSTVASPEELQELIHRNAERKNGSLKFKRAWRHWLYRSINAIRHDLSQNLPHAVANDEFEQLFFSLGVAADEGTILQGRFSDEGARSGYALEFFCRARLLADTLLHATHPESTHPAKTECNNDPFPPSPLFDTIGSSNQSSFVMTSIGGGPGFDFVGAALVSTFCNDNSNKNNAAIGPTVKATVLDYEVGWADLVQAMGDSTCSILRQPHFQCDWGGTCDITQSLHHPSNQACLPLVATTHLWSCQYCVAENAQSLQENHYQFFQDLFEVLPSHAMVIVTETTTRLWPAFFDMVETHCPDMTIRFPSYVGGCVMMFQKRGKQHSGTTNRTAVVSESDRRQLDEFRKQAEMHQAKMESGSQRQRKKNRGGGATFLPQALPS